MPVHGRVWRAGEDRGGLRDRADVQRGDGDDLCEEGHSRGSMLGTRGSLRFSQRVDDSQTHRSCRGKQAGRDANG